MDIATKVFFENIQVILESLPKAKDYHDGFITIPVQKEWWDDGVSIIGQLEPQIRTTLFEYIFQKSPCGTYWIPPKSLTKSFDFNLERLIKSIQKWD